MSKVDESSSNWWSILKDLPAVLAAVGVFLYGLLYVIYSRFYGSLGLSPEEVGLGYGNIFLRSLGLLAALTISGLLIPLAYLLRYINRLLAAPPVDRLSHGDLEAFLKRRERSRQRTGVRIPREVASMLLFMLPVLIMLIFTYQALGLASTSAVLVQQGGKTNPLRLGPITLLSFRADPVRISWNGPSSPDQKSLLVHRLLHLGEGGGKTLLYDSTTQRVVRAPSAALVSMTANCEASEPHSKPTVESSCEFEYPASRPGVDLRSANLYAHDLNRVNLQDADLRSANMRKTELIAANLERADLRQADLRNAVLWAANLRGADLRGAKIERALFHRAEADTNTKWPRGFNPRANGVVISKG